MEKLKNNKKIIIIIGVIILIIISIYVLTKIDEYKYNVTMMNESPKCTIWCTDTEPKQEGNVLNLGCK